MVDKCFDTTQCYSVLLNNEPMEPVHTEYIMYIGKYLHNCLSMYVVLNYMYLTFLVLLLLGFSVLYERYVYFGNIEGENVRAFSSIKSSDFPVKDISDCCMYIFDGHYFPI